MVRTLCIANQKGGVGKTTTAINLAVSLAKAGKRTVLVDLDPQCNATSGLAVEPTKRHPFLQPVPIDQLINEMDTDRLSLIPGSRSFADSDALAQGQVNTATKLKQLTANPANFDYVLVDCPPSLGTLTESALTAATEVLMPVQCEYFAMEGLTQMIHVIRRVMQQRGGQLQFGGVLLTMYDQALELTLEVEDEVREFFGDIVYDTVIPRDVAAAEAPSFGQSVLDYAPRSRATRAYVELCMEVLDHEQG